MSRTPKQKELDNTRLASNYGGWIYCESCQKTIGYLCYVTYDRFRLDYQCKCGGQGGMYISFDEQKEPKPSEEKLVTIKNRLCCPKDQAPLFTLLTKNLESYQFHIVCAKCGARYEEKL